MKPTRIITIIVISIILIAIIITVIVLNTKTNTNTSSQENKNINSQENNDINSQKKYNKYQLINGNLMSDDGICYNYPSQEFINNFNQMSARTNFINMPCRDTTELKMPYTINQCIPDLCNKNNEYYYSKCKENTYCNCNEMCTSNKCLDNKCL
jgi:hypothetical protein